VRRLARGGTASDVILAGQHEACQTRGADSLLVRLAPKVFGDGLRDALDPRALRAISNRSRWAAAGA
jgi:hypothetical protein